MKETKIIPIERIVPNPYQPRLEFNEESLFDLAQSIRENGLIQPISVREAKGHYEIVAGERRFRAMQLLGMTEVSAYVMDADEMQMAELALVENVQRENLSAIEEAKAYLQIMKITGCTQSQLAMKMGKSQSSIANKIRLLNLDDNIQNAVSSKIITERHARALSVPVAWSSFFSSTTLTSWKLMYRTFCSLSNCSSSKQLLIAFTTFINNSSTI